ncbi:MAG: hypothetical protein BWY80_00912 [Firmicutes bacterium ADurb.Bin456]|nr:MAG: hypothetical protein BWY80_00912 [Firmicutes bacterium ADurb.Bin456]
MNPETRKALTESVKREVLADLQFQGGAYAPEDSWNDLPRGDRPYSLKSTRQAYLDLTEAIWQDVLNGIGTIEEFIEKKIGRRGFSRFRAGGGYDQWPGPEERKKIKRDVLNELRFAIPDKPGRDNHSHVRGQRALVESIKQEILAAMEAQQEAREESLEKEEQNREQQYGGAHGDSRANSQSLSRAEVERIKRDVLSELRTRP